MDLNIKDLMPDQSHLPEALQAKYFDLAKGVFRINGTTYYYQPALKTIRNARFQQLSINIGTEATVDYLFDEISAAGDVILKSNSIAESLIKAHQIIFNIQQRIGNIKQKMEDQDLVTHVHEMAALILVTESENTRQIDEAVMKKKYEDFINSDYAYDAFFFLCLSHIANFRKIMSKISEVRSILEKAAERTSGIG